jgi:hypothetical protein
MMMMMITSPGIFINYAGIIFSENEVNKVTMLLQPAPAEDPSELGTDIRRFSR